MGRRGSRAGEGQALPCPSQCAFSHRSAICGAVASAVWPCQALLTGTVLLMCPAWGAHQAVGSSGPGEWDVLPVDVRCSTLDMGETDSCMLMMVPERMRSLGHHHGDRL